MSSLALIIAANFLFSCSSKVKTTKRAIPVNGDQILDPSDEEQNKSPDISENAKKTTMVSGCVDPDLSKVLSTVTLTLCNGTAGKGKMYMPSQCIQDGETGCLTSSEFKAAATAGLANKVLNGQTVAGVGGNIVLPAQGKVLTGTNY